MGKKPKRKPYEEMTQEELEQALREDEALLERIQKADIQVRAVLDNKQLWEDLAVHSMELNDAIEDMNEQLAEIESKFRGLRTRPGWVTMSYEKPPKWFRGKPETKTGALIWNGKNLIWEPDDPKQSGGLVREVSKSIRMATCGHLDALWNELNRPRLIPEPAARTP